jgi:hypothetical protein
MATTSHVNAVAVNTTTTGTGSITVGTVVDVAHVSPAQAGAVDGATYRYKITDGNDIEFGYAISSASATVFSRNATFSKISGTVSLNSGGTANKITLSGAAQFRIIVGAEDFNDYLQLVGGTLSGPLNWAAMSTLASAGFTDLTSVTSNYVNVTGTTTITSLGTIASGAFRWVRFSGVLTLTHNATSLICIGNANITTAAGDVGLFISEGAGNWRVLDYVRADNSPISGFATAAQFLADTPAKVLSTDSVWNSGIETALTSVADATVTMTIATPGVITDTAHGFTGNEPVHFTTTGALPTGLTINTEYYVLVSGLTTNTYSVAATRGGSAIATSGTQSGVHTRVRRVLVDFSLGSFFGLTLTRNITLAKPYNQKAGQQGRIRLTQDGTGSRLAVFPTGTTGFKTAGGTAMTISTAASAEDIVYCDAVSATELLASLAKAFA